jgi:predicted thioesterase
MAVRATQVVREALLTPVPLARVTQVAREVLATTVLAARVTQVAREVLQSSAETPDIGPKASYLNRRRAG